MANNPYSLIHQRPGGVNYKQYDDRGHITPNFEYSEGIRPAGEFMPAPYLPAVRFNTYFEEFVVLSGGKVVAFDSNGYIVPAGLALDLAAEIAVGGSSIVEYNADDASRGVLNANGVAVVAGEKVAAGLIAAGVTVSNPIGLSSYNYWTNPGGNGENPATFNTMNFSLQNKVAFVTDYVVQVPTVIDQAAYDAAPYKGMGCLVGAAPKPGEFVTFDAWSNFVSLGYNIGATEPGSVVGQILSVEDDSPKDLLDQVRTRYSEFDELEKMPGSATGGKSDTITYSGGYGLVTINLTTR